MIDELHNLIHALGDPARRKGWPLYQNHRNPQGSSRVKLCPRAVATRVLGDDEVYAMALQKLPVACLGERATGDDGFRIRQRQWPLERIDETQEVVVPRLRSEDAEVLPADGKKDASRMIWQRGDRSGQVRHGVPVVARTPHPRRADERAEPGSRQGAGFDRIAAHPFGERVGRIDDIGNCFGFEIGREPRDAAETANPRRQRLDSGRAGPTGIGIDRIHPVRGETAGKQSRFGRAAKKKDTRHG